MVGCLPLSHTATPTTTTTTTPVAAVRYALPVLLWLWVIYLFFFLDDTTTTNNNNNNHRSPHGFLHVTTTPKTTTTTTVERSSADGTTTPSSQQEQQQQSLFDDDDDADGDDAIVDDDDDNAFTGDPLVRDYDPVRCLDDASCVNETRGGGHWLVPAAIIAGTQKGGTRALLHYLSEHPAAFTWQGTEAKILNNVGHMVAAPAQQRQQQTEDDVEFTVDPCFARRSYHDLFASKQGDLYDATADPQPLLFDKSPSYMLHSEIVPQRLTCVFPATSPPKIIMVLRNPTDRAYSHFHHNDDKYGPRPEAFADVIDREMTLLHDLGLSNSTTTAAGQAAFWKRYRRRAPKKWSLVARGLYAMQLRQWLGVLHDAYGSDLSDVLLILESERLRSDTVAVLDDVSDFLRLEPFVWPETDAHHAHSYAPLDDTTRRRLDDFYRPWNAQLRDLLAPYGVSLSWTLE